MSVASYVFRVGTRLTRALLSAGYVVREGDDPGGACARSARDRCEEGDEGRNESYFLKWKTFNKLQRKGRELDPRDFNEQEKLAFSLSDAK